MVDVGDIKGAQSLACSKFADNRQRRWDFLLDGSHLVSLYDPILREIVDIQS